MARDGIPKSGPPQERSARVDLDILSNLDVRPAFGTPVFGAAQVAAGAHVTGIGTDMPHKNELPPALFGRAATIATDDHEQCLRTRCGCRLPGLCPIARLSSPPATRNAPVSGG